MSEFHVKNILISKNIKLNPQKISLKNPYNSLFFDASTSGLFFYERLKNLVDNFLLYLHIYFFFSTFYNYKKISNYKSSNLKNLNIFFSCFWIPRNLSSLMWSLFEYYKNMLIFLKGTFFFYQPLFLYNFRDHWFFSLKQYKCYSWHFLFIIFQKFYSVFLSALKI